MSRKKGKIICKLVHCNVLSESWNGCLPWSAEERFLCFVFLFFNKTCPSHHKTRHRPPLLLPRASTRGVQRHTLRMLAITIIIESMSKLCFYTKLKRIPSHPRPFSKTPNKETKKKILELRLTSVDTIRFLCITVTRVINFFLSQEKGSCHAP